MDFQQENFKLFSLERTHRVVNTSSMYVLICSLDKYSDFAVGKPQFDKASQQYH